MRGTAVRNLIIGAWGGETADCTSSSSFSDATIRRGAACSMVTASFGRLGHLVAMVGWLPEQVVHLWGNGANRGRRRPASYRCREH